ncbi:MAG: chromosomal replication initiator protein DnaA [Candidatus Pelagibacter sp.]|nr:chromosomal replication initiator protein DnaA [Candidatus Pelagibacter sp.]|tara:strand:+ start:5998 stop:7386 length:1389 start_codon:yes stop_codon:yes gene_type:complete
MENSSALKISENIKKNWENVQLKLKESYGLDVYKSWIQNVEAKGINFSSLILVVKTRFVRDWIVAHYADKILDHYQKLDNTVSRIQFEINEIFDEKRGGNILDFGSGTKVIDLKDTNYGINRIDPRLNFESFVTGESNQLAFSAAKRVAESLGHYNPLYVYGGVGLGKTHILNAIGNQLKQFEKKVIYLSAERFMYQFVKSIKNKDTHKFKEIFRNANVLILDDIQFISGKEVTQEEFFYTFNSLLENQSQVVISCDRSPNELDRIQDRIKSRLSGGLVVDVQPPDIGLRLEILKKRCLAEKNHFGNEILINDEILSFISNEFKSSIRDMLGVLNRVIASARIQNKTPTLQDAKLILKDLLNNMQSVISIEDIQKMVVDYYNLSMNDFLSSRRSRHIARPRQIAMYLSKKLTTKSLPEIGRKFTGRDHTTVIHAIKKIEELMSKDRQFEYEVQSITDRIIKR